MATNNKTYMNSDDLIASVKSRITLPVNNAYTFSNEDILDAASAEMIEKLVPQIMEYHEEYFSFTERRPLLTDIINYSMPTRAIGAKLNDLFYEDSGRNLFEMSRVSNADRLNMSASRTTSNFIQQYYFENDDVVLNSSGNTIADGHLLFVFFIRPNKLVTTNRAAICNYFVKQIDFGVNASAGDTITLNGSVFTAVASGAMAYQFNIGATIALTIANFVSAVTTSSVATLAVANATNALIKYSTYSYTFASSNTSITINTNEALEFTSIPSNITNSSKIDFLKTESSHKLYKYDIRLSSTAISNNIISFAAGTVPSNYQIGDYICTAGECIIPMIPSDFHSTLASKAASRILLSQGDYEGLNALKADIGQSDKYQQSMVMNRVEGSPRKVLNLHSHIRNSGRNRRF